MKVTTKKGDQGMTDIANQRVEKGSSIICFVGELDRCMAQMIECAAVYPELKEELKVLVDDLSKIAATVTGYSCFDKERIETLELKCLELNQKECCFSFDYPFDNPLAAKLNLIRAEVRSCERMFWKMENESFQEIGVYLNRLSDWFYLKQISC